MAKVINANAFNFSGTMNTLFRHYSECVHEAIEYCVPLVAKEACKKLRQTSPRKSGQYAKNWKWQREKGKARYVVVARVYGGKPTYRLAHLLEYGHARRGGGRQVAGIEHIKPVAEWANDELLDQIIERLSKVQI